jgi:hypothetical protein
MGMTPAPELIRLWTQEVLDAERAIGQILQHLVQLHATGESQRAALAHMRTEIERLRSAGEASATATPPKPHKPHRPR